MRAVLIIASVFVVLQIEAKPLLRFKRGAEVDVDAETCITELNLDKKEIFEISNRDYAPENNADYTKFMKCYWNRIGYLLPDGSVNYAALRKMITDIFAEDFSSETTGIIVDGVFDTCKNIQAHSKGLRAIRVENCILGSLKRLLDE